MSECCEQTSQKRVVCKCNVRAVFLATHVVSLSGQWTASEALMVLIWALPCIMHQGGYFGNELQENFGK